MLVRVSDQNRVYNAAYLTIPFDVGEPGAEAAIQALAIETMYGCALLEVEPCHVREMFARLTIEVVA